MRAWTPERPGDGLRLSDLDEPTVRPGGVLLEILAAQRPRLHRRRRGRAARSRPDPAGARAGGVGRVLAVADDVLGLAPGDVVVHTVLLSSGGRGGPAGDPRRLGAGTTAGITAAGAVDVVLDALGAVGMHRRLTLRRTA